MTKRFFSNYMQSTLIITKTFVDYNRLERSLAYCFFNQIQYSDLKNLDEKHTQKLWNQNLNLGKIIKIQAVGKEDFETEISTFYKKYNQPVLIFLGDLSNYSLALQESLLKFLEEPPQNLNLIIYSRETNNILPTILSRCTKINLTNEFILQNLDLELLELVKKKLPPVQDFAKKIISEYPENIIIPNLKEVERNELDFWLWQIEYYLVKYYLSRPNSVIGTKILKITEVKNFNHKNLQKKFALNWLRII